jgi:hypothetical protein
MRAGFERAEFRYRRQRFQYLFVFFDKLLGFQLNHFLKLGLVQEQLDRAVDAHLNHALVKGLLYIILRPFPKSAHFRFDVVRRRDEKDWYID